MEQLLKSYATDSLNIQNIIGEDMFYYSYKIKNGKLVVEGKRDKERTSDNYTSLIFVIDIESKKLISTIEDPVKDYANLEYEMIDDSTLFIAHKFMQKQCEIYLSNIFNQNIEKLEIKFDASANAPAIIDANGKQLFMTCNVYGFAVADLNTLKGKVFVNSNFSTLQSTVSYPIDKNLNLLSGTFKYDSSYRESITIYAIDDESQVKWEKTLPFIEYDISDAFYFYNYGSHFIIKYHNAVECLDKENGKVVWNFINEQPITQTFMVGNKLVVHSSSAGNVIPSENEKEMKKIKDTYYREVFKIVDLKNGKVLWSKNISGTNSEIGILGNDIFVYNDKNAFILNLENMQELPINEKFDQNKTFLTNKMDTKTGKVYLEHNGILYW